MTSASVPVAESIEACLGQLHGQLTRLQRELSEVRGVDANTVEWRIRLRREITATTFRIRELAKSRFSVGE